MTIRELLLALYRFDLDAEVAIRGAYGERLTIDKVGAQSSYTPDIIPLRGLTTAKPRRDALGRRRKAAA